MKLGTVRTATSSRAFSRSGDDVRYHDAEDVLQLISQPGWAHEDGEPGSTPLDEDLLPPIVSPRKVICAGLNYLDHAAEVGKEPPAVPTLFAKMATTLIGARDDIEFPLISTRIDWEAELAIVIGEEIRNADLESAGRAILGYTVMNDVSTRDWQNRTSEWFQGKNFDRTAPTGPVIVTPDEIDIAGGVAVECLVNGEVMQSGTTASMIFSPADLIVYITQFLTLQPGDIIATGTPAGVGSGRKPPVFLSEHDVVTTRIEGIGELVNRCVSRPL